ncbi:MAG: hypothetical protein VX763_06340 [Actinomycetota bacterium]|nr:hypothetical protein [Actinomycetota bacterium]
MKRSLLLLLPVALLVGACGSSGKPESFTEQKGPLPADLQDYQNELLGDGNPSLVPLVQRNFLEGCMGGSKQLFAQLSGAALARACGCSYTELVRFLEANESLEKSAFDTFKDLDKASKEADGVLGQNYRAIFEECKAAA